MRLMYFIHQSSSRDINRGSNNRRRRKWQTHTIWSDHVRRERGRTPNFCPTIALQVYYLDFKGPCYKSPWFHGFQKWNYQKFILC